MRYEAYEIFDILDNVNCVEDIQALVTSMHDYPEMFPRNFYSKHKRLLLIYSDLFI